MYRKWIHCTLLGEMCIGTAIMENRETFFRNWNRTVTDDLVVRFLHSSPQEGKGVDDSGVCTPSATAVVCATAKVRRVCKYAWVDGYREKIRGICRTECHEVIKQKENAKICAKMNEPGGFYTMWRCWKTARMVSFILFETTASWAHRNWVSSGYQGLEAKQSKAAC